MTIAKPQTTSLIETLNQGFRVINRHLWVIAIPVLLNVYLWYGVQISFQPLIDNIVTLMQQSAPVIDGASTSALYDGWRVFGQYDIMQRFDALGLVPRLSMYVVTSVQNGGLPLPEQVLPPLDAGRVALEVGSASVAVLLYLLVNIALIPLSAAFLTMIAAAVRTERSGRWFGHFAWATLSILGYAVILLAALLVLGLPLVVLGGLLSLVSPAFGALIALLLLVGSFWVSIYTGFAPEAIALGERDPLKAIRGSFMVVRRYFWGSVLLLALSFGITVGLGIVWHSLVGSTIGLVVAIIGSAYIGSGLRAARMVFYRERIATMVRV